ncbi:MAG: riboflavin biosynthesis protein RibF [Phycisphaerales bacterium]|nr:riboflavin biosynthesis protein RibF [Phycisphaerales bacterium]
MDRFSSIADFRSDARPVVLTIGNFDGVHRGHRRLVDAARAAAAKIGGRVVAMTFDPHPLAVLAPERAPARLTTLPERLDLLELIGVDAAIVLRTDRDLLAIPADEFLTLLRDKLKPAAIVEGPTFNFGRGRAGSIETLRAHAAALGYEAIIVDELYGRELGGNPPINSSAIRAAIVDGRISDANAMLGRPYRITGVVGHGDNRGRTIGFPTANLEAIPHLLPGEAVYAAAAQLADGAILLAAVNIGPQPTFAQMKSRVEAHLLDFDRDLRGRRVGLHLLSRLRGQTRFESVDALVDQIRRDVARTREFERAVSSLREAPRLALGEAPRITS